VTTLLSADRSKAWAAGRKFVRTPKGLMTIGLVLMGVVAGVALGPGRIAPGVAAAVLAAAIVDEPILRVRGRWWMFPDGAILTGLFVAMVLSPFEPWRC